MKDFISLCCENARPYYFGKYPVKVFYLPKKETDKSYLLEIAFCVSVGKNILFEIWTPKSVTFFDPLFNCIRVEKWFLDRELNKLNLS